MNKNSRVAVTGLGVISPIGFGVKDFWRNLIAGKSGISEISSFDTANFRTHKAAEVKYFNPRKFMNNPENKGRVAQFLLAAIKLAIKDSGLDLARFKPSDINAIIGTTADFEHEILAELLKAKLKKGDRNVPPSLILKGMVYTPSIVVASELGFRGSVFAIPTACASGNYTIGYGFDLIKQNRAKLVFCCGVDIFCKLIFAGFNRLFIIAPDKCQPFDKNRKGTMLGEGSAVLILESLEGALKRGANIYAEVLGYGLSCDAYSMTIPTKDGMIRVMRNAIKNCRIRKEDVDYISAHGSGTLNNDKEESWSIKKIFGSRSGNIPVSSIKSMLGHTLGADSSMEAISCCLSIRDNIIPPTINYETPDPECDIDIVANKARKKTIDIVMNNSFGFGGNNCCVIFGRAKKLF